MRNIEPKSVYASYTVFYKLNGRIKCLDFDNNFDYYHFLLCATRMGCFDWIEAWGWDGSTIEQLWRLPRRLFQLAVKG